MCKQALWDDTEHLMTFVDDVVPRIYEYNGNRYPAWEKADNPRNVWLISKKKLDVNVDHKGSYPHSRAEGNGYYIYGFTYDRKKDGQARGEFYRYLANKHRTDREWKIYDRNGNPVLPIPNSPIKNVSVKIRAGKNSSVTKSTTPAQPAVKNMKKAEKQAKEKEDTPSCKECKTIIQKNFQLFLETYQKTHEGVKFEDSNDVTMFYRNADDIEKVQKWNEDNKTGVDDLIDPCAFNEAFLGNIDDPDILILGKNPGAGGIFDILKEKTILDRLSEMKARKHFAATKVFYPLSSEKVMKDLPWFANRLIFGVGNGNPNKWNLQKAQGILSRFIGEDLQIVCRDYANRIASVELVPYHTRKFGNAARLQKQFGVVSEVRKIVKEAIKRNAVILCPYYGAVDMWLKNVQELDGYDYFYTTHTRYGEKNEPYPDGSLNINRLRHYSKIKSTREQNENCEPLFQRLVELGWKEIK